MSKLNNLNSIETQKTDALTSLLGHYGMGQMDYVIESLPANYTSLESLLKMPRLDKREFRIFNTVNDDLVFIVFNNEEPDVGNAVFITSQSNKDEVDLHLTDLYVFIRSSSRPISDMVCDIMTAGKECDITINLISHPSGNIK